jgi:hypothetical protein
VSKSESECEFSKSQIHRNIDSATPKQALPIRAALIGSDCCGAEGITVRAAAPVLALCRKLASAGHDPRRPLHAYRGDVLALRVRSIGEGAQLAVAGDGIGFRRQKAEATASRTRFAKPEALPLRYKKPLNSGEIHLPYMPGGTEGKAKTE